MNKSTGGTILKSQTTQQVGGGTKVKPSRTVTSVRTNTSSAQGSSAHAQKAVPEKPRPRVLDEFNNDVTPKSLFESEAVMVKQRVGSGMFRSMEGTSTPTEIASNANSILNTNTTNIMMTNAQSFGAFYETSTHVSNDSNQIPTDSIQENVGEKEKEAPALFFTNVDKPKETKSDRTVSINIKETDTFVLMNVVAVCVSNEDENIAKVKENNAKYLELCKNKIGNDTYADRGMNTFNDPPKVKTTQTERITISEKGCWATVWDMHDSMSPRGNQEDNDEDEGSRRSSQVGLENAASTSDAASSVNKTKTSFTETGTVISDINGSGSKPEAKVNKHELDLTAFLESQNFKLNTFFMERLLNQNTYQPKQARYRGLKPLEFPTEEGAEKPRKSSIFNQFETPSLEKLWTYTCSLTKDRNVSCITWNNKNKDILAVGYGKFEYNDDPSGLVCCWSLKNPEFPERYYKTESGITSVAFSQKHSNLLAVGMFNGNILVFDVRNNNTAPLLNTNESEHRHLSPVWNLKWTDRDRTNSNGEAEEMEVLMSISSDGRVTQWMIRKGFESTDYLKLKRVSSKAGPAAAATAAANPASTGKKEKDKSDGFISRYSGGLTFDIWDQDKIIYLCGTEEGSVHRCSTSYNEQYLDTYYGHTGPVYKVLWSPFLKNSFITASADWTIRLWKANRTQPCLTFNSASKSVYDMCWSTHSATVFCCVNESTIELWDLKKSTLDPIYNTNPLGTSKLTAISWSPNSDCLVVGTNEGGLLVYSIKNLPAPTTANDLDDLIKQSLVSQLETIKQEDEEEDKEALEKHQLDALNASAEQQKEIEDEQEKLAKLNAFEAKLDKIKQDNENVLKGKHVKKIGDESGAQLPARKVPDTSESSDEN